MTKDEYIKFQESKKQMLLELGSINYSLDIVRTSITLITYNLTENDKVKKLPAFDYAKCRKLCSEINSIIVGVSDDYFSNNVPGYEKFNPNSKPVPKYLDPKASAPEQDAKDDTKKQDKKGEKN